MNNKLKNNQTQPSLKFNNPSLLRSTSLENSNPSPFGDFPWKGKKVKAFTLVELIVVITILAILWTIAFISLQWYSRDARDSTRISDINSIEKQLELFVIKTWTLPIPENNIELVSSWVTIWYQWYADKATLNILKVFNWWLDPVDQTPYTYRISWNKKSYQIMWFLENWNVAYNNIPSPFGRGLGWGLFPQANAATNLTNRFPFSKWKVLWILLEPTTNTPLQELLWTWQLDIRSYTWSVNMYITNTIKQTWKVNELYWTMENMSRSQKFDKPQKDCPTWYIPVPWNMDFWQPAFCVAKYEMSYADSYWDTLSTAWNMFNTVSYTWAKIPASMTWKFPIAGITQQQAIDSCKSIWSWYHLITNNEWMSIARNIEQQPVNWSNWITWSWYIYTWVSNSSQWCYDVTFYLYTSLVRVWVTKTWPWFGNTSCDNKRKLTLSNWEKIWDLSWNVQEHVNKANTIDWVNYNLWTNPTLWNANGGWGVRWNTLITINRLLYWPLLDNLDVQNWVWFIFQGNWVEFIRGGNSYYGADDGIYQLNLLQSSDYSNGLVGFRCAR